MFLSAANKPVFHRSTNIEAAQDTSSVLYFRSLKKLLVSFGIDTINRMEYKLATLSNPYSFTKRNETGRDR